jgi:hypothetical protein
MWLEYARFYLLILKLVIPANAGIQTFHKRAGRQSGFPRSRE